MSFVDKFKKILFDDVDDSEELPERTPKSKKEPSNEGHGFIEYHNEEEEENPIREIKVPKEEKEPPKVEEQIDKFNFPVDTDMDVDFKVPTRQRNYEEMDINFLEEEPEEEIKLVKEVNSFTTTASKEIPRKEREKKDYRKILEAENNKEVPKKPFTNTPVISPVWGILDKNYKPEEIVDRTDALTKVNTGAVPRTYGPVSYNDQPLLQKKKSTKVMEKNLDEVRDSISERPKKKESKVAQTEELIELNTAITDLINEPIEVEEEKSVIKPPIKKAKSTLKSEKEEVPTHSIDDIDDEIIQTDNYDEIEEVDTNFNEDSIENENNVNNNIEDAFESTSEFDSIRENETEVIQEDEEDEVVDMNSIISRPEKDNEEDDAGLDNTIETDLFNLIDSMYKDEDE